MKNALLAGINIAKEAADPAYLRAGLVAAAEKGKELAEAAPGVARQVAEVAAANPGTATCVVVGAVGVGVVTAPMAAAAPAMALGGFSSACPVAGSLAATAQAAVGNVAAGGAFATIQSAAMGGYGVAAVSTAVQGVGATMIGTAGGAAAWMRSKI